MPSPVYERNVCIISMWYCPVAGDGIKLFKAFEEWVENRPVIKQVQYCVQVIGVRNLMHMEFLMA